MGHLLKVCCIQSLDEARLAAAAGASHIGMLPSRPEAPLSIPAERVGEIAAAMAAEVTTVMVTLEQGVEALVALHRRCRTAAIQLARPLAAGTYAALRAALPGVALIQSVHVHGPDAIDFARAHAPHVDMLLLDSGRADGPVAELGNTGRIHDWRLSRAIVAEGLRPVLLAGGIRPENVADAARAVGPDGFDICTGVRVEGRLDPARLAALRAALEGAGP